MSLSRGRKINTSLKVATNEEIFETIDVAIEMGGGQAGAYARFVLRALEYFKAQPQSGK